MTDRLRRIFARRWPLWLLGATLLAFFGPVLFGGQVFYCNDNSLELGLAPGPVEGTISTRQYSDQSLTYVPELHHNLNGRSSGWISTWNPHVELGRPSFQIFGLGRAFLVTRMLAWLERDAFRNYTLCGVLALALSALFGFKLLEALGLSRTAAVVGALGLGLGLKPASSLLFVVFLWGTCWTLGLLWLVTATFRKPTAGSLFGLALCTHCLFVSAYPQQVVWSGYLLVGYTLLTAARSGRGLRSTAGILGGVGAAVAVGALGALPLYLDLLTQAGLSSRVSTDPAFLIQAMPRLESWRDAAIHLTTSFDALWFGNVVAPEYPAYVGFSATPLFALLAVPALTRRSARRFWPILAFAVVCVLCDFSEAVYRFGIDHLGLSFSRFKAMSQLQIPVMVLAAYGVDRVLRDGRRRPWRETLAGLALVGFVLVCALTSGLELRTAWVVIGLLFALGALAFLWTQKPLLVILLALASTFHHGFRTQVRRPRSAIFETSPLVEAIRQRTPDGRRFAWVRHRGGYDMDEGRVRLIGPNTEALLGLRSIHTYDSLSSRAYQSWTLELNGQENDMSFGRRFSDVRDLEPLSDERRRLTGVSVLLSPQVLVVPGTTLDETVGFMHLFTLGEAPLLEARFPDFARDEEGGVTIEGFTDADCEPAERTLDLDDALDFRIRPAPRETLLFVSQQFHPYWHATSDGAALETVRVNGLYQGVILPPDTAEVRLRFRPNVRWMWVPQFLFAALGALLLGAVALRRARGYRSPSSARNSS